MEEEKKVSEETKAIMQKANPYSKVREEDDAETEAFAKGELAKFQREQKERGLKLRSSRVGLMRFKMIPSSRARYRLII